MNIEQSSGQGDEKVMDIQIEKEMVAYFIMKNRKKRTQWELESTRKRDEGIRFKVVYPNSRSKQ